MDKNNLHTFVKIKETGTKALVEEISIGIYGTSFRIAYWNNGERYSVWVNELEIEEIKL